jgi:hypothetical protein
MSEELTTKESEEKSPKAVMKYMPVSKRPPGKPRKQITDTSGSSDSVGSTPQTDDSE